MFWREKQLADDNYNINNGTTNNKNKTINKKVIT